MGKETDTTTIDEDSLECLEQAKKGKPRRFVAICKGASIVSLVVYKKGNVQKFIKEAKESGRGQAYFGVVDGRGMDLNFKLARSDGFDKEPVRNAALKSFLEESDFKCKPIFEIVDSNSLVLDDDDALHKRFLSLQDKALAAVDEHPNQAAKINALCLEIGKHLDRDERDAAEPKIGGLEKLLAGLLPPTTPPSSEVDTEQEKERFVGRLKLLKSDIQKVVSGKVSVSEKVGKIAGDFALAARGNDFVEANRLLDEIETPVKTGLSELNAKEIGARVQQFVERMKALMPSIKQAAQGGTPLAQEIKDKASEAGLLAKKQTEMDLVQANALLDEIEIKLQSVTPGSQEGSRSGGPTSAPREGTPKPESESTTRMGTALADEVLTKSADDWTNTQAQVALDLTALEKELIAACQKQTDDCRSRQRFDMTDVATKARRLTEVTQQIDGRLARQLRTALAAKENGERVKQQQAALDLARQHLAFLSNSALVSAIEKSKLPSAKLVQAAKSGLNDVVSRLTV